MKILIDLWAIIKSMPKWWTEFIVESCENFIRAANTDVQLHVPNQKELRIVEIKDGEIWMQVDSLVDVKKGQIFRMTEPDGILVGKFKAVCDGFIDNAGLQSIDAGLVHKSQEQNTPKHFR